MDNNSNYKFIKGNICDEILLKDIFKKYDIDTVINFAAESHVDRSLTNSNVFYMTNVIGTQMLLNTCLNYWKVDKNDKLSREFKKGSKYLQISTDEVYGAAKENEQFNESSALSPNNPYAASKAGADHIVMAYYKSFGLPTNITRCSNNYGPYQHPEKFIPHMIYYGI